MKPEMNMMDLVRNCREPHKESPGPKAEARVNTKNEKTDKTSTEGGETQKGSNNKVIEKPAFKKIMNEVVKANKKAVSSNEGRMGLHSQKTEEAEKSMEPKDKLNAQASVVSDDFAIETINYEGMFASYGVQVPEFAQDLTAGKGATNSVPDASSILQKAIENISQALHLKIGQGLENVRIDHPTPAMKELLAEMLFSLKNIVGLLEQAEKSNVAIDIGSTLLDASQAASVDKMLRTEIFHIEIALAMVENGRDVAALVAQKSNKPVDTGLIQAMNPNAIAMPDSQIQQVLDMSVFSSGQKFETLFLKLVYLLREQYANGKMVAAETAFDAPMIKQEATITDMKASNEGKNVPVLGAFDAQVMRMLLKIDKTEEGNKEAALQNEKFDLPKIAEALFAKKPGEITGVHDDTLDAVLQGILAGKDKTGSAEFLSQLKSAVVQKTLEESVMNQLAVKLQEAVKTGVTEIRLLLRPESLGEMRVKLTLDGDVVMGKIYVENQQVKHIIETNMQSLKDSLAQHNLQTGSFDVNVGGRAREQLTGLAQQQQDHSEHDDAGASDASEQTDAVVDNSIGAETGRRFGSNTIEYFA